MMTRAGEPLTFLGNAPYPARRNDWPRLAALADQLLAQREERYPALVEAGKMTALDADRGIRVMRAVTLQWRRVVERKALPEPADYTRDLGASWSEMQVELDEVARRASNRAERNPDDRGAREQAELTAALAWQQQPTDPSCAWPHLALSHAYAQWERGREQSWAAA